MQENNWCIVVWLDWCWIFVFIQIMWITVNPNISGWLCCHQMVFHSARWFVYNIPLSTLANVSTSARLAQATALDVCSHEVFCLSFCKPKWFGQRKQRNNIQNLRRTVTYTETQHQQRLAGESADLGFICWTKDCVSSSGWIGQVHRARHIPQRTWSWNKQRGNRGRGLLFYSSSPSLFIPSPWVLMNGDRQHPCSCQDETAVKSWLLSLSA